MKRVLVFGNLGYIGTVLVEALRASTETNTQIVGFDNCYFERTFSSASASNEGKAGVQHYGDVRKIDPAIFSNVTSVIYLAAISNDPMGLAFAVPTHEINARAAVQVAEMAKAAGVAAFVFASSCSVYGAGGDSPRTETDLLDPLTDYARSKVCAEAGLASLARPDFAITCLRFATACGPSRRMRLDLVLNDFVAAAKTKRRIVILSDGTPLRPLIDTRDMAQALIWAADRRALDGGSFLTVNTGNNDWNFSVLEIAEKVRSYYDNIEIEVNDSAASDKRSYRVDFSLFRTLAPKFYPNRTLDDTVAAVDAALEKSPVGLVGFRDGPLIRLNVLRQLQETGALDANLRWTG